MRTWRALCVVLVWSGIVVAWPLCVSQTAPYFLVGSFALQAGSALLGSFLCFDGFKRLHQQHLVLQRAPLLMGIGLLCNAISALLQVLSQLSWFPDPLDLHDIITTISYIIFIISLLSFPLLRLSSSLRARFAADSSLIILALATFSWYFLLGPSLLHSSEPLSKWLFPLLYPFIDLLLLAYMILAFQRSLALNRGLSVVFAWLIAAMFISTVTDVVNMYLTLDDHASIVVNHFFALIYPTAGMAWQMRRLPLEIQGREQNAKSDWVTLLLPYVFVILTLLLLCWIWVTEETGQQAIGTEIGGLLLIGIVLLRQIFAMRTIHEANQRLASLALTDPLTGLPNHRCLLDRLEAELEQARRSGSTVSIVFFDGDRFKRVNDTYGHAVGDGVLRELGTRVRDVLHNKGMLGRYGGEEFLAVLPGCDKAQAVQVAEEMRAAVAATPLVSTLVHEGIDATISVGVAVYPTDGASSSQVIELADQAMYCAKHLGRNQVRTSADVTQIGQKMPSVDASALR